MRFSTSAIASTLLISAGLAAAAPAAPPVERAARSVSLADGLLDGLNIAPPASSPVARAAAAERRQAQTVTDPAVQAKYDASVAAVQKVDDFISGRSGGTCVRPHPSCVLCEGAAAVGCPSRSLQGGPADVALWTPDRYDDLQKLLKDAREASAAFNTAQAAANALPPATRRQLQSAGGDDADLAGGSLSTGRNGVLCADVVGADCGSGAKFVPSHVAFTGDEQLYPLPSVVVAL